MNIESIFLSWHIKTKNSIALPRSHWMRWHFVDHPSHKRLRVDGGIGREKQRDGSLRFNAITPTRFLSLSNVTEAAAPFSPMPSDYCSIRKRRKKHYFSSPLMIKPTMGMSSALSGALLLSSIVSFNCVLRVESFCGSDLRAICYDVCYSVVHLFQLRTGSFHSSQLYEQLRESWGFIL